jgi:hypothetical protein
VYLGYIGQKAANLPDEYKKLIEEKKEYYDELMRRISMIDGDDDHKGEAKEA